MRHIHSILNYFIRIYPKHHQLFFILLLLGLTVLAWSLRFIQDDAFISFRYAEHLAQGKGLVWNEGYRIEGFTNFLWSLMIAAGIYLGLEPVLFSQILGLLFFIVAILSIYKITGLVFKSNDLALLTVLLTGINFTFSSYAACGLETMMQTGLILLAVHLSLKISEEIGKNRLRLFSLSIILSIALLTRLDSAVFIAVILLFLLYCAIKSLYSLKIKLISFLICALPLIIIVGFWLYWKWNYFGDFLPNTYYIKAGNAVYFSYGLKYIYIFLFSNMLILFPVLFVLSLPKLLPVINAKWIFMITLTACWLAYIIKIGGDFMEFRFMVPILPFIIILYIWLIFNVVLQRFIRVILILMIFIGFLHHMLTFGGITFVTEIASFKELSAQVESKNINWADIGKILGRDLNYHPDVTIAVTAAGAIPFYSKLRAIDMLGLNDKWIARNGIPYRDKPGHRKITTLNYLLQEKVNLIIAHPQIVDHNHIYQSAFPIKDFSRFRVPIDNYNDIPQEASLVQIPLINDYTLLAFYLLPHPEIEKLLQKSIWQKVPCQR